MQQCSLVRTVGNEPLVVGSIGSPIAEAGEPVKIISLAEPPRILNISIFKVLSMLSCFKSVLGSYLMRPAVLQDIKMCVRI